MTSPYRTLKVSPVFSYRLSLNNASNHVSYVTNQRNNRLIQSNATTSSITWHWIMLLWAALDSAGHLTDTCQTIIPLILKKKYMNLTAALNSCPRNFTQATYLLQSRVHYALDFSIFHSNKINNCIEKSSCIQENTNYKNKLTRKLERHRLYFWHAFYAASLQWIRDAVYFLNQHSNVP